MIKLRFIVKAFALIVLSDTLSSCVLTVENTAGDLEAIMGKARKVSTLRISGPLNGDDILYLREILTSESCKVSTLDLSNASIVGGGRMAYITYHSYKKIKIFTSEDKIGNYMFCGCKFRTVILPNTITSIGDSAFSGCTSLKEIDIPDSVTSIGSSAFSGCTSLTEVTIGNNVTLIGSYAFHNCTSLKEIDIPDSVTSIDYVFGGCTSLTEVSIGNNVTSIRGSFYDCICLTNVTIGNNVTSIVAQAFSGCTSLTEVTIGNNVTLIGGYAFRGCTSLTEVTIGNNVNSIEYDAFKGCTSLYTLIIGDGVTSIGDSAFDECGQLYEFYCYATTPPRIGSETFTNPSAFLYVPKGSLEAYKVAWDQYFKNIFEMK